MIVADAFLDAVGVHTPDLILTAGYGNLTLPDHG